MALYSENSLDMATWILAVMAYGAIFLPLPPVVPAMGVVGLAKRLSLQAVFTTSQKAEELTATPLPCQVYRMSEKPVGTQASLGYGEPLSPEDPAAILLTSGTTSQQKAVVLSQKALMRSAYYGIHYPNPKDGSPEERKVLTTIPMVHIFGICMGFLSFLCVGAEVWVAPDSMSAIRLIPMVRPTVLILVPGLVQLLVGLAKMRGKQFLADLDTIICGGAPVPGHLFPATAELGLDMYVGYGMTEGAGLTAGGAGHDAPRGSVGRIYPGVQVKIVDGELWFRGDTTMDGYLGDPLTTADTKIDGWIRSGDLGRVDEEGWVYLSGRAGNLIILDNGENVSPEELETLLQACPLIREVLVREVITEGTPSIGAEILPNEDAAKALSLTSEKVQAGIQAAVDQLNDTLPPYKRIAQVILRDTPFPKSGSGEIRRQG